MWSYLDVFSSLSVSVVKEREADILSVYAISALSTSLSLSLYISSSILVYLSTFSSVIPSNSSASSTPTPACVSLRPPHSTTKCSTAPHSKQSTAPPENLFLPLSSRVLVAKWCSLLLLNVSHFRSADGVTDFLVRWTVCCVKLRRSVSTICIAKRCSIFHYIQMLWRNQLYLSAFPNRLSTKSQCYERLYFTDIRVNTNNARSFLRSRQKLKSFDVYDSVSGLFNIYYWIVCYYCLAFKVNVGSRNILIDCFRNLIIFHNFTYVMYA